MSWLDRAACVGEDPALFDKVTFPAAFEALKICRNCFVSEQCEEWVRPNKSHYDGVAAGVVWRNGYRVRPNNTTREDKILKRRGENVPDPTPIPEVHGQRTLPFD